MPPASDPADIDVVTGGTVTVRTGAVPERLNRSGLAYAVTAYVLWGMLPLYFLLVAPTGPFELVAVRVIFSLLFCALLLTVTRAWKPFFRLLVTPKISFTMALAGALIFVNWQTYVFGVLNGQVVEASLGYFINPIVTVFLGVFFLRERLRLIQWISVGISILAVLVLAVGAGGVPWIALILAFSFGLYGYIKKRVGPRVDAVAGLTLETTWLLPVAILQLVFVGLTTGLTIGTVSPVHTALLVGTGVITAVPLLLFAAASRRLPLVWMGFIQFFAPVIQFLFGVLVLHEEMPLERWIGFALVWLALIVLTVDMAAGARRSAVQRNKAAGTRP
ncbi:EamA family transporter RarD [Mycetocola miduiensis]|uniref:Chloramphenicol-sensitive protein RarD n=1 Tax=Mycetocola miduiensis TaxID=995034 RepID=A0A1I5D5A9_9MICO|nr:EamA family transporter RarD [Mycetocola miduiensis]SFN94409.1 chloramphenicol-sensitive protein RarD [Mycetocola miduiensis]